MKIVGFFLFTAVLLHVLVTPVVVNAQELVFLEDSLGVQGMSRNGQWLVGRRGKPGQATPFLWSAGTGVRQLELIRADDERLELPRFPVEVSNDGQVFVGHGESPRSRDSDMEALRWTDSTGWRTLSDSDSTIAGMSANGSAIVGTYYRDDQPIDTPRRAYVWTTEHELTTISPISQEPAADRFLTFGRDVSADGKIVVGQSTAFWDGRALRRETRAFRWTRQSGSVGLGPVAERTINHSNAASISSNGEFIGGIISSDEAGVEPFLWSADTGIVPLETNGTTWDDFGPGAGVFAISDTAEVLLGRSLDGFHVWDDERQILPLVTYLEQRTELDLSDWREVKDVMMSDDGKLFSGNVVFQDGTFASWHLNTVPEPSASLGWCVLLLLAVRRTKCTIGPSHR